MIALAEAQQAALDLIAYLQQRGHDHVLVAGSVRRGCPDVRDLDLVVVGRERLSAERLFGGRLGGFRYVDEDEEYADGPEKGRLLRLVLPGWLGPLRDLQVDLRQARPETYGCTLLWLTGSRTFGFELEERAKVKGWSFTPEGLMAADGIHYAVPDQTTEQAVFDALELPYVPPVFREGTIENAARMLAASVDVELERLTCSG